MKRFIIWDAPDAKGIRLIPGWLKVLKADPKTGRIDLERTFDIDQSTVFTFRELVLYKIMDKDTRTLFIAP